MFERFTENAINVIMLAQNESRRMGWNFVGTEQILLGLVGEGSGLAAQALNSKGVSISNARAEIDKIVGRGNQEVVAEIPFTPRSKRLLELAWYSARDLGHNYIGTEHLLLGLIREGEGVAARALENLGVNLGELRDAVTKLIARYGNQESHKTTATELPENAVPVPAPPAPAESANSAFGQGQNIAHALANEQPTLVDRMREEARKLGHNFIGTEQILLGILAEDTTVAAKSLKEARITIENAREAVEKIIGRGSGFVASEIPFTPRSKRVLELSWQEAREFGHSYIGPEHLLLGLIRERDGVAIRVLENLGVDLKKLEKRIRESLAEN